MSYCGLAHCCCTRVLLYLWWEVAVRATPLLQVFPHRMATVIGEEKAIS